MAAAAVAAAEESADLVEEARPRRILLHQDVVAGLERHEARARNARGDQPTFLERRPLVLAAVQHERRHAHLLRELDDVDAVRHVEDPLGGLRRRGQALDLVERGDLLGRSVGQELGGEELAEGGVVAAPAEIG